MPMRSFFPSGSLSSAADEDARLRSLAALHVLDSPPEPIFDDLVLLASHLCEAPIALVSLVDGNRQWFKARCGLEKDETPREYAFCAHALAAPELLEVPDALADARFCDNPLVTGAPGIRFYAGAPLVGRGGAIYGTLCVIDTVARRLSQPQRDALMRMSRQVVSQLEARADRQAAQLQASTLSHLLESVPDGVVSCDAQGMLSQFNRTAREWHGTDPRAVAPAQWAHHLDLFDPTGTRLLTPDEIPLHRAWLGERVRDAEIVIKAAGQPPRAVRCNADPLDGGGEAPLGAVCVMHDVTAEREMAASLAASAARLERALDGAELGLWELRVDEMNMRVDARGAAMLGFGPGEAIKTVDAWNAVLHPADRAANVTVFAQYLQGRSSTYENEFRVLTEGGAANAVLWLYSKGKITQRDADGRPTRIIGTFMNVTERKRKDEELERAAQLLRQSGQIAKVGGWTLDLATNLARWTEEVYRIHDLEPSQSPDLSAALDFYTPECRPVIAAAVAQCMQDGTPWDLELEIISHKGRRVWVRAQGEASYEDGRVVRLSGAFQDITESKREQLQLERLNTTLAELSYTDTLTGLGNRRLFDDTITAEWARASRDGLPLALLMIDVDHFKRYNDLHGHPAGDECLKRVAALLQGALFRGHEKAMRYGGEEFLVLLPGTTLEGAEIVAQRILDALEHAAIAHHAAAAGPVVTVSIGVAAAEPSEQTRAATLLRSADMALYEAKASGRARMVSAPPLAQAAPSPITPDTAGARAGFGSCP